MTQSDDARAWALIRKLQGVEGQEARREALTWSLLESFPEDLREATAAAAIPHWFNAGVIAALLPDRAGEAEALYRELQRQHFVEPYAGRGHALHELTRRAILDRLWREDPERYRSLSAKAGQHLAALDESDPAIQIEGLYHGLVVDEDAALEALTRLHDNFRNVGARYHLAEALLRAATEQAEAGHLSRRGQLYVISERALLAVYRCEWAQATAWLQEVLHETDDRWLQARASMYLGVVHVRLAEYPAARARYEEALPLYRAIGDRLGEANTIRSLGDVHVRLAEYPAARARYAEALPLYRAIGDRLGEANTIASLGDLEAEVERYADAEARYAEAEAIYRAIETPANVASMFSRKANVFTQKGDYSRAVETYTQAIALQPDYAMWYRNRASAHLEWGNVKAARADLAQAAELQPEHPYLAVRRADLALLEGDGELALRYCAEAHKQMPGISGPYFTEGLALLRLGRPAEARSAFEQGIERAGRSDLSSAIHWVERHGPGGAVQAEILKMLREAVESKRARYL